MSFDDSDCVERHIAVSPGGGTIRVVVRGQGPLLLMINGIGAHVDTWEPLAEKLSHNRRLVLFDAPGAGDSPPLSKRTPMAGLADMVVRMLDALHITRLDVLGFSWGGTLAQELAHLYPARVRRLILVSTSSGFGGKLPKLRVTAALLSPEATLSEGSKHLAATIFGGDYKPSEGRPSRELSSVWYAHPPTMRGYAHQLYAISGWSSRLWLRRISQPTLVISGTDDPLVPWQNAKMLARLLPHATLCIIPGGGHLWLLDHATSSAALIERFLDETALPNGA